MDHLLTVTFSAPERQKVQNAPMDTFEGAIRRAFPARRHRHTVSNPRFATDRDPHIAQVLARLDAQDDVLIQPCLVSPGPEWEKLRTLLSGCSHPFRRLALGRPLLASREDALDCARAILPELPDTPVVFLAHGSKDPSAPDISPILESAFGELGRTNVFFANLEGENGLEQLLPRLRETELQLRPFLFCPRLHRQRDLEGVWIDALTRAGHQVDCRTPGLCTYPGLQQLYIRHAREAEPL